MKRNNLNVAKINYATFPASEKPMDIIRFAADAAHINYELLFRAGILAPIEGESEEVRSAKHHLIKSIKVIVGYARPNKRERRKGV